MSTITKEVKCITCGSYMHDAKRCYVWRNIIFCRTSHTWNRECNCEKCINRCQYCNNYLYDNGVCFDGHNGKRCLECNEFLRHDNSKCHWNHDEPLCQFCNLPIMKSSGKCTNFHDKKYKICSECDMPLVTHHVHDGVKCKVCNSLLNHGKCFYGCIDGGNRCTYCNIGGIHKNQCLNCRRDNSGRFTKRAIK